MLEVVEKLEKRMVELDNELMNPEIHSDQNKIKAISQERRRIEEILATGREYKACIETIKAADEMLAESDDPELTKMAKDEIETTTRKRNELEQKLALLLAPSDPNDVKNAIIEIRAGTGGEEAAIFASDLYRMYTRYSERKGWKVEVLSSSFSGIGGFKEVIFMVRGESVYGHLKYESGVHRVQRVPKTESQGRIHTSAATVAVLLEAEEVDIKIDENELKIDVYHSSGPGGQSVNTTDSAVRITHLPSGMVVTCQDEKSQHKNKAKALRVLRARLLDKATEEQNREISEKRREMVSTGDRSAKIRTYNFPQSRVTDHRIGLTLHRLDEILDGDLNEVVEALAKDEQEARLEEQNSGNNINAGSKQ